MKATVFILALFIPFSVVQAAQEKICSGQPVFQCEVKGGKNIALCGNYNKTELVGVQYVFGRSSKKELIFPGGGANLGGFKSNHYFRYQVDYKAVKFSVGSYSYELYSNYNGEDKESQGKTAGINVAKQGSAKSTEIQCTQVYVDDLKNVVGKLKCDDEDALGCSN